LYILGYTLSSEPVRPWETVIEEKLIFHIGSEVDTKILGYAVNDREVRIVSKDSAIGRSVLGKKVGDVVKVVETGYRINEITGSELSE
jgi:hypothetical protein